MLAVTQAPQEQSIESLHLFPVQVFRSVLHGALHLNDAIAAHVEQMAQSQLGVKASNLGGWHSTYALLDAPQWPFDEFKLQVLELYAAVRKELYAHSGPLPDALRIQGWANLNGPGDINRSHTHMMGGCHWSGVYYVQIPERTQGGRLILQDRVLDENTGPRPFWRTPMLHDDPFACGREVAIDPVPGEVVLFPSSMHHRVEPFTGSGGRISLAFNIADPALRWRGSAEPAQAPLADWLRFYFYGPFALASRVAREVSRRLARR